MPRLHSSPERKSTRKSPKRMNGCDKLTGDTSTCLGCAVSPSAFVVLRANSVGKSLLNQAHRPTGKGQKGDTCPRLTGSLRNAISCALRPYASRQEESVMKTKDRVSLLGMLLCLSSALGYIGCGGASTPPPSISVSVSQTTATINTGTTDQFTATVENDPANKGVGWSVFCSAASCGTVSPTSTASGAATTYTPPALLAA